MPKAPRVSVVIDNFNYGRYLRDAIGSCLEQGLGPDELEVLVVDDGSTDDSREIIASYGPPVRGILQPNSGQATAFNRGIGEARGEFVALLDSDDAFLPGKLAKVLPLFDDPGVGLVQHFLRDTDAAFRPLPRAMPDWPDRYRLEDALEGRARFTATSGLTFRRSVLEKCMPIPRDMMYYLDDLLAIRSLFHSEAANLREVLGWHRVHGENWCAGNYEDPRKIERDFKDRAVFRRELDAALASAGRSRSAAAVEEEELELWRRRVLLAALRARPDEAWREWVGGLRALPRGRRALFRAATTLVAVASPTLYLALYSLYSDALARRDARVRGDRA